MIRPRMEAFRVSFAEEQLEDLFVAQSSDINAERYSGEWFGLNVPFPYPQLIEDADHTLLVATRRLDDAPLIQALQSRADAGVRIYLLLGREADNHPAIEALAGRCLIRTGVAQNGTLIIKNPMLNTAHGILLSSGFADSRYWLRLTPGQREDYYRLFCHLFWEEALGEHLQQGVKPRKAVSNPLGRIDLNHQDPLANKLTNNLRISWPDMSQGSLTGIFSQLDLDTWPQAPSGVLISELKQMNVERGIKLCQKVSHLALTEYSGLPQIMQGEDQQHWMLPQSTKAEEVNWCVRLTTAQRHEVAPHLQRWQQQARWQLRRQLRVADITSPIRFVDQLDQEHQCLPLRTIELEPVRTGTFEQFMHGDTRQLAGQQIRLQRDQLACEIDFSVAIHPPYCPEKATDDPLLNAWQRAQQNWSERISTLSRVLAQEDGEQSRLGERIRNALGSFFAGQSQSRRELERALTDLADWDCTLDPPSVRQEQLARLNQLTDQIHGRRDRLSQKVDETQQQQYWEQTRQSLLDAQELARSELRKQHALSEQHQRRRPEAQEKLQQAFLQHWHNWIDEAEKSDSSGENNKSNNKHNKNNQKNNWDFDAIRVLDKTQAIGWINKHQKQLQGDLKRTAKRLQDDLQQGEQKLARNDKELQQQLQRAEREAERLAQELETLGERFVYAPSQDATAALAKVLGNRSLTKAEPLNIKWPTEELPQTGTTLRLLNKQRWLVITTTEQLPRAQQDAKRLNATLCTESLNHG